MIEMGFLNPGRNTGVIATPNRCGRARPLDTRQRDTLRLFVELDQQRKVTNVCGMRIRGWTMRTMDTHREQQGYAKCRRAWLMVRNCGLRLGRDPQTRWRRRSLMRAVNRAAQTRGGCFGTAATHQRSFAAIHSLHCLAHAAFALAKVHRNTGKRAAGQHQQKD